MKLYCVRHGEAESAAVDPARGLTLQGRHDVTKVGRYLGARGVSVHHILRSGKERAKQTAEILAAQMKVAQIDEVERLLDPDALTSPLLDMIGAFTDDTMLVGHLPFMAKLVSALVIDNDAYYPIVQYPPGTVICLEYYEGRRWIVNWILQPVIVPDD